MKIISTTQQLTTAVAQRVANRQPKRTHLPDTAVLLGTYAIGAPGSGKTKWLEAQIVQDMAAGRGLLAIDMHEDLHNSLLRHAAILTHHRPQLAERIVILDPRRPDASASLNPLLTAPGIAPERTALDLSDALVALFGINPAESPRLVYLFSQVFLALTCLNLSILDSAKWLQDQDWREMQMERLPEHIRAYWEHEWPRRSKKEAHQWSSPFLNKVNRLLFNPELRPLLTGTAPLNFRQAMDQKKWVFVNASKGKLGEGSANLLSAFIVSQLYQAALSRADASYRPLFRVYLDEFQNFCTSNVTQILSECRKYAVALVLSHQYLAQLPEAIRLGVINTVATMLCFRVGYADARVLAKEMFPGPFYSELLPQPLGVGWDALALELSNQLPREVWIRRRGPYQPIKRQTPTVPDIPATPQVEQAVLALVDGVRPHQQPPSLLPVTPASVTVIPPASVPVAASTNDVVIEAEEAFDVTPPATSNEFATLESPEGASQVVEVWTLESGEQIIWTTQSPMPTSAQHESLQLSLLYQPANDLDRETSVLLMFPEHDGGPLTPIQISTYLFPQNLLKMLSWYHLDRAAATALTNSYSPDYLDERMQLGQWLRNLAKSEPAQFAMLAPEWQEIVELERKEWLLQAITTTTALPPAFLTREHHPSAHTASECKKVLKQLTDAGLIDRVKSKYATQYLYYLTPSGRRELVKRLQGHGEQVTAKELRTMPVGHYSGIKATHRLQNIDIQISIRLAAQRLGYELVEALDEIALQALLEKHKVTFTMQENPDVPQSVQEFTGMTVPDYYFLLRAGDKYFAHFVEIDRAKVTGKYTKLNQKDYRRKIHIVSEVYRSGLYHQLFPNAGNSFRYLTITTGSTDAKGSDRLLNLKIIAEEAVDELCSSPRQRHDACQRFWFARHHEAWAPCYYNFFTEETILNAPIWYQAGRDEERYALIW